MEWLKKTKNYTAVADTFLESLRVTGNFVVKVNAEVANYMPTLGV